MLIEQRLLRVSVLSNRSPSSLLTVENQLSITALSCRSSVQQGQPNDGTLRGRGRSRAIVEEQSRDDSQRENGHRPFQSLGQLVVTPVGDGCHIHCGSQDVADRSDAVCGAAPG